MRPFRTTSIRVRLGGALGAAVLLGVCSGQAFSASGVDILCNRSDDSCTTLEIPADKRAIDVADHDAVKDVAAEDLDTSATSNRAMPLAKLKSSGRPDKAADMADAEKTDTVTRDDDPPRPNSRFPGVSDDDALRYRRQMYRTDI